MAFLVEITPRAKADLDAILIWLAEEQAGETGLRWFCRLREAIDSLSEFPRRCSLAPEDRAVSFEVRHLLFGARPHVYRILFTIQDQTVTVLSVRHGRRLPSTP